MLHAPSGGSLIDLLFKSFHFYTPGSTRIYLFLDPRPFLRRTLCRRIPLRIYRIARPQGQRNCTQHTRICGTLPVYLCRLKDLKYFPLPVVFILVCGGEQIALSLSDAICMNEVKLFTLPA